ncbi:a185f4ed-cad8-4a15-b505-c1e75acf2edd [Thermothielavioides terrestris]|uniref:A185f4ed-cad8-4a15-b505-c1e75acf2edd n=1 Tax=Thermothielavioides terrestris TaxID=2587410 RepID=A0A446BUP5_9PEZI|nr:a185f4ed-cad8-4a15-b505-c1e75acf2edd [Thermothielavioides terrestris]
MFRYNPDDSWDVVTLWETSTCGTDPKQIHEVLFKGDVTENYFVTNQGDRPAPPPGGTNVQMWKRTYYDTYQVEGTFTLVDPPPTTSCSLDQPPAWEIHDFQLGASCGCPAAPFSLPNPGFRTHFTLLNLADNYSVVCDAFTSDLPILQNSTDPWNVCGVDPDDAPFLPPTWFRMDRATHMLSLNQTWLCETDDGDL